MNKFTNCRGSEKWRYFINIGRERNGLEVDWKC